MNLRIVVLVIVVAVLAAVGLAGCGPESYSPDGYAGACRAMCGELPIRSFKADVRGWECACDPVACSVDRLVVIPTPRGPDGKIRRGAEGGGR